MSPGIPCMTFPAQTPASVGLGARGTPFSQTLSILERLRDGCRVLLVARSRGQVDRLLALLREHDAPAIEWRPSGWSASGARRALPSLSCTASCQRDFCLPICGWRS